MSSHTTARKHPAATSGQRGPAARSKASGSTPPVPRRRVAAKHVTHVAGSIGGAVVLETAARLICEHVLPVALPFLH
jgi:hypothetical protein